MTKDGAGEALLNVIGCAKRFGGVTALAGADLTIDAGEIHALLGENGAGKSTLIKCLSGVVQPDAGEIRLDGQPIRIADAHAAESLGFRFIHQELNLVPQFDAVENAFVGRPYPRRGGLIHRAAMRREVAATAEAVAPDLPLDIPVGRLTTGQRQMVAIIRALLGSPARLVVMDEPTASLSEAEAGRLQAVVRALAGRGVAVLFISHRLEEVLALCDRYTVMRGGAVAGTGAMRGTTRGQLVRLMSGRDEAVTRRDGLPPAGAPVLVVRDLPFGRKRMRLNLSLAEGEIAGVYGLIGSGRSSLVKQLWGARRHAGGDIIIAGVRQPMGGIASRIKAGAAYLPEDRRAEGLIVPRSIADNLALAQLSTVRRFRWLPLIDRGRMAERTEAARRSLAIRMASPWARPLTLSGGNQQKLLFGRWFGRRIRLLLLDEPTRGVDIGAKGEIHALIRAYAAEGAAVLVVTSDLDELMALSHRVLVLARGELTADGPAAGLRRTGIIAAAFDHAATALPSTAELVP